MEQFWQAFASRGFVSDKWAFLYILAVGNIMDHTSAAGVAKFLNKFGMSNFDASEVTDAVRDFSPIGSWMTVT